MKHIRLGPVIAAALVLGLAVAAFAFYSTSGAGTGSGTVGTLDAATISAPATSSGSNTITWTQQAALSDTSKNSQIKYVVQRKLEPGSFADVPSGPCSGEKSHGIASCTDTVTTAGTYTYRVIAKYSGWSAMSNEAEIDVTITPTDTTPPALTTLEMFDVDKNGKVDEVKATFNEPIQNSTATAPWTLADVPSGGSLASVSTSGSVATLTLSEGTDAADTAVGSFKVALAADANGIRDAAGNQASFGETAPSDKAAPARVRTEMFDASPTTPNGKIDKVEIQFSEALASYSAGTAPWNLTGIPSGGTLSSVTVASPTATLNITEGEDARDTAVGSFLIDLTASATGIRDSAGNQTSFDDAAPADKAAPVRTTLEMFDTDTNRKVDQVKAKFSEQLAAYTVTPTTTGWTLANTPGGNTLTGVTVATDTATLTLSQTGGVSENTSAGTWTGTGGTTFNPFTVALAANAAGIRDAAGNQSSFGATNVTDKAAPIPTLTFTRSSNNDTPSQGDKINVAFTEPLAVASMCAGGTGWSGNTTDQTLTADGDVSLRIEHNTAPTTSNDRLLVQAINNGKCTTSTSFGTVDLGSQAYVGTNQDAAASGTNRSKITWTFSNRTLVFELGTITASAVTANVTATWASTPGMTDIAGNAPLTASDTGNKHF